MLKKVISVCISQIILGAAFTSNSNASIHSVMP